MSQRKSFTPEAGLAPATERATAAPRPDNRAARLARERAAAAAKQRREALTLAEEAERAIILKALKHPSQKNTAAMEKALAAADTERAAAKTAYSKASANLLALEDAIREKTKGFYPETVAASKPERFGLPSTSFFRPLAWMKNGLRNLSDKPVDKQLTAMMEEWQLRTKEVALLKEKAAIVDLSDEPIGPRDGGYRVALAKARSRRLAGLNDAASVHADQRIDAEEYRKANNLPPLASLPEDMDRDEVERQFFTDGEATDSSRSTAPPPARVEVPVRIAPETDASVEGEEEPVAEERVLLTEEQAGKMTAQEMNEYLGNNMSPHAEMRRGEEEPVAKDPVLLTAAQAEKMTPEEMNAYLRSNMATKDELEAGKRRLHGPVSYGGNRGLNALNPSLEQTQRQGRTADQKYTYRPGQEAAEVKTETPTEILTPLYQKVQARLNQLTNLEDGEIKAAKALKDLPSLKLEIDDLRNELDLYFQTLRTTDAYKWVDQQIAQLYDLYREQEAANERSTQQHRTEMDEFMNAGMRAAEQAQFKKEHGYDLAEAFRGKREVAEAIQRLREIDGARSSEIFEAFTAEVRKIDAKALERLKKLLGTEDVATAYVLLSDKLEQSWKALADADLDASSDAADELLREKSRQAQLMATVNEIVGLPSELHNTLAWERFRADVPAETEDGTTADTILVRPHLAEDTKRETRARVRANRITQPDSMNQDSQGDLDEESVRQRRLDSHRITQPDSITEDSSRITDPDLDLAQRSTRFNVLPPKPERSSNKAKPSKKLSLPVPGQSRRSSTPPAAATGQRRRAA